MRSTEVNARWPLVLPDHRADWHDTHDWWELARLADMYTHLKEGDSLIDVGSEEGDLTALYASWGCTVHYMEPNREWHDQTLQTFEANNLTPGIGFMGFASDQTREGSDLHKGGGFAHLNERPDIPQIKIDDFITWTGPVDALMIDVEGSELRVLKGAERTLEDQGPIVWVSIHPEFMQDRYGDTEEDLFEFMDGIGYNRAFLGYHHEWDWRFWRA